MQARLAQLVMIVQFSIIGIMIFGDKLFPMLGMQPPDMYEQVKDKKFAVGEGSDSTYVCIDDTSEAATLQCHAMSGLQMPHHSCTAAAATSTAWLFHDQWQCRHGCMVLWQHGAKLFVKHWCL